MSMHHLTISSVGRLVLARSEAERRALVRALARTGRERLFAFGLADDHAHGGITGERPRMIARDVRRALLAVRPDLRLQAPHLKLVDRRPYLRWLVTYVLRQVKKHELGAHPALWSGSCFQDLVGARLLSGYSGAPLRAALPPLRIRDLLEDMGLEPVPLEPVCDEQLRGAGPERLVTLAASVYCVGPQLTGRSSPVVAARALAAAVGVKLGFSRAALAPLLGATPQTIGRLATRTPDPAAVRALRLRLVLEERVRALGREAA
jgi:hypothetical protein